MIKLAVPGLLAITRLGLVLKNDDFSRVTPVIDKITNLIGGTVTIFQRMNEKGAMLRVATTVPTSEGKRAIGTFIPEINPDSTRNDVISQILKGNIYHGRAFVVNAWYLTAYQPITDENGYITEIAEKKPISDIATVGIYYWNKGSEYKN